MTSADVSTWPDLFIVKDFLTPDTCSAIVAELKAAQGDAATVYGRAISGSVDRGIRQTLRLRPADNVVELIKTRLLAQQPADAIARWRSPSTWRSWSGARWE